MDQKHTPQARARAAYDAASDTYDHPALGFWERFGRRTVEQLALPRGARVLDVCCGSGASALPAAEIVGPAGVVVGIDISERLLALARAKAEGRGISHVTFRIGELEGLDVPPQSFDAVVCVFGVFFAPDMAAAIRGMWDAIRPGGTLALTTWGPRLFEPGNTAFWDAVRGEQPALYRGFNPWDRLDRPETLTALCSEAGVRDAHVVAEPGEHALSEPADFWHIVLGSGYRGTLEQMEHAARERVRLSMLRAMEGVGAITVDILRAVAIKPARG
jgi:SAM-dependent methyltransferase